MNEYPSIEIYVSNRVRAINQDLDFHLQLTFGNGNFNEMHQYKTTVEDLKKWINNRLKYQKEFRFKYQIKRHNDSKKLLKWISEFPDDMKIEIC